MAARHAVLLATKDIEIKDGEARGANSTEDPVILREESDDEDVSMAHAPSGNGADFNDDKKTLGLHTTYQGFSIWGLTLYVLVGRKNVTSAKSPTGNSGQGLMEEWMMSTQEQANDNSAIA